MCVCVCPSICVQSKVPHSPLVQPISSPFRLHFSQVFIIVFRFARSSSPLPGGAAFPTKPAHREKKEKEKRKRNGNGQNQQQQQKERESTSAQSKQTTHTPGRQKKGGEKIRSRVRRQRRPFLCVGVCICLLFLISWRSETTVGLCKILSASSHSVSVSLSFLFFSVTPLILRSASHSYSSLLDLTSLSPFLRSRLHS